MAALLPVTGPDQPVVADTKEQAAQLLDVSAAGLSWLPYAGGGVVVMRREEQLDDGAVNTRASFLLERGLGKTGLGVRGPVLVFPAGADWIEVA